MPRDRPRGHAPPSEFILPLESDSQPAYRRLFENMSEAFALCEMIWDAEGGPRDFRYLQVNRAWTSLTGIPIEQTVGRTGRQIDPGIEHCWIETYARVVRTGEAVSFDNYAAGLSKWFETHAFKHAENSFGLLFLDITERRGAEEALKESRERLRLAATAARLFAFEWDSVTDRVWRGGGAEEILGVPSTEESATDYYSRVHPDDRSRFVALIGALSPEHDRYSIIYRVLHPNGEPVWLEESARASFDENGRLTKLIGMTADVTDRKRVEEALSESEERFRVAQDLSPDGFTILRPVYDEDGAIIDFTWVYENATIARMNGTDPHGVIGRRLSELMPHHAETPFHKAYIEAAKTGVPQVLEACYRRDIPKLTWFRVAVVSMGNDIAVLAQDITERKRAEDELKAAKDYAEKANEAKDRFLATLSHELRTPLTPILAAAHMLERRADVSPAVAEYIALIKRNVTLEARLIDDLLDLNRIVYGKISLSKTVISAHEIVSRALETCKNAAQEKGVDIELVLRAVSHDVDGDSARLQQVFWNLLSNGIKFTPAGGRITVRTANPNSKLLEISVTDTGKGIEPRLLEKIFDAFEQGGRDTQRQFGGLGLGLAISRRLVELHHGAIKARSRGSNQGAAFIVTLPLAQASPSMRQLSESCPQRVRIRGRVLLVEDHEDTAAMMREILEWKGIDVVHSCDVASALDRLERENFDLMLCDLGLPDGNGLEVMRTAGREKIRGIALTGRGMEEDVRACADAGFIMHLTKPVDLEKLENTIEQLLRSDSSTS